MNKLLDLFKEIAIAIREKRHYDRELLIEEMPEEIRKIGVYNDWEFQRDADCYIEDGTEWSQFIEVEGLDYTIRNKLGYIVYQNDGDSDYPHYLVSYPAFTSEDMGAYAMGDTVHTVGISYCKGADSWIFHDDPWVRVTVDTGADTEIDKHVRIAGTIGTRFEGGADWAGVFVLGGRDPVD